MGEKYDMNAHPVLAEPFGTHLTVWYQSGPVRAVALASGVTMHNGDVYIMIYGHKQGANSVDVRTITRGWHPDAA